MNVNLPYELRFFLDFVNYGTISPSRELKPAEGESYEDYFVRNKEAFLKEGILDDMGHPMAPPAD